MIIPKNISPRYNYIPIKNKYYIETKKDGLIFNVIIYYINKHKCKIIIRRLDKMHGWKHNYKLKLYSVNKKHTKYYEIEKSNENYKIFELDVSIKLEKTNLFYEQLIPKVIIQTAYNNKCANVLHYNSVMSFLELNPEYEYKFFDHSECREFIKQNLNTITLDAYDLLVPDEFKQDLFKYCYLYKNGGCYFDSNMVLTKPLRKYLQKTDVLNLCTDKIPDAYSPAIILCDKNNLDIKNALDKCVQNILARKSTDGDFNDLLVLKEYIPLALTGSILFFHSIKNSKTSKILFKFFNDELITTSYSKKTVLYKQYKNYSDNNSNNNYNNLWKKNEIYYDNSIIINNYKLYIYPHNLNYKFTFEILNNVLNITCDNLNKWEFDLKIKIINNNTNKICLFNVGSSDIKTKKININYLSYINEDLELKEFNFNPSLLIYDQKTNPDKLKYSNYLLIRSEIIHLNAKDKLATSIFNYKISKLDDNFSVVDENYMTFDLNNKLYTEIVKVNIDYSQKYLCTEDIKIFYADDKRILGTTNCLTECNLTLWTSHKFMVGIVSINVEKSIIKLEKIFEIENMRGQEKNWCIIKNNGKYYVIYSLIPLKIYTLDIDTLDLQYYNTFETSNIIKDNIALFDNLQITYKDIYINISGHPIQIEDNKYLIFLKKRNNQEIYSYYPAILNINLNIKNNDIDNDIDNDINININTISIGVNFNPVFSDRLLYLNNINLIDDYLYFNFGVNDQTFKIEKQPLSKYLAIDYKMYNIT